MLEFSAQLYYHILEDNLRNTYYLLCRDHGILSGMPGLLMQMLKPPRPGTVLLIFIAFGLTLLDSHQILIRH